MIGRRGAIGGLMAWWAAGNARSQLGPQAREAQRPDRKPLGTTRAGTGPAPSQGIIRALQVIVGGSGGATGVFTYSGVPGSGDLATSQTQSTVDPFGTTTVPGIAAYAPGTPAINVEMTAGGIIFNQSGVNAPAIAGSNASAALILSSGRVNSTDNESSIDLTPGVAGALATVSVVNGDTNTYDVARLNVRSPGTTINSAVTPVTIFSKHVIAEEYDVEVWLWTNNTTAADGALISFTGPAASSAFIDWESISGAGAGVLNHGTNTTYTTAFGTQGVAGNQILIIRLVATFSAAGTLALTGLESVAGNTVAVLANSRFKLEPVVAS